MNHPPASLFSTIIALSFSLLFTVMLILTNMALSQHPSRLTKDVQVKPALEVSTSLLTPESRLEIKVLRTGKGPYPKSGDRVKIHYRGSFEDGTEFDSSYRKKVPLEFVVGYGRVIEGMDFSIRRIKLGSKAKVWIPWEMAYGKDGYASVIPPRANLLFEVELISVEPSGIPESLPDVTDLEYQIFEGIKIWTLEDAQGSPARKDERIRLHYVGWLENGTVFESSYFSSKPASYRQGARAIPGWKSVMKIAKPSQVLFVEIPPRLAYGPQSLKGIPADSKLFFYIHLLSVEKSTETEMEKRKVKN